MSLAIYIGIAFAGGAFAAVCLLFLISARLLFPAPIVEDEEPHGDASMLRRDRE